MSLSINQRLNNAFTVPVISSNPSIIKNAALYVSIGNSGIANLRQPQPSHKGKGTTNSINKKNGIAKNS